MTKCKIPINPSLFCCEICDYNTGSKKDYNKHLSTLKHKILTNPNEKIPINPKSYICNCGKEYKHSSSLSGHKKKCLFEEEKEEEKEEEEIDYKDVILTLLKQNKELQNTLINQQQEYQNTLINQQQVAQNQQHELQKTIKEIIPKIGNNNTTTNNNNQFNLQMFLNEDCKDALNIKDFVNSLQLSIKDLTDTGKLGYVDGISRIFVNALNDMDVTERPIHCTDIKRETVYIKDADKWEKEESNNPKLKKTIRAIENKNLRMIPKWQEENPESRIMDTRQADELMVISINALGGNEEKEKLEKKIVKNVLKEIRIDKNI